MFLENNWMVVCLQETHFMANDKYTFRLPGFTAYHTYCPHGGRGGGVSLFVSNSVPHFQVQVRSRLQAVVCSIRTSQRRIAVCSLYLPPNESFTFDEINDLINELPQPFILCTDANSKHFMWGSRQNDSRGNIWMDVITRNALCLLNDGQPTRLDDYTGTESHIDLSISTGDIAHLIDWNTIKDLHSSDHFPIHIDLGPGAGLTFTDMANTFMGWNVNKANWTEFRRLCNFTFDDQCGLDNCEMITDAIVDAAGQCIPTKRRNSKFTCPWWTDQCREALQERRRAQNRMRRDPYSDFLRIEYRKAKAKARRVVREAQVSSWRNLISTFTHRTPMSKLWETLRRFATKRQTAHMMPVLRDDRGVIDDPTEVANMFGRYFAGMSGRSMYQNAFLRREERLADEMPEFDSDNQEDYNREFTLRELRDAIERSGSNSVGPDKLHYTFFRYMDDAQLSEILRLFNYIWAQDVFPQVWRHSYIVPILKPGKDRNLVQSYRPIQLTSVLCKLMERMIGRRFTWWLETYSLLSKNQCAFRANRGTMDHVVRIESHIRDGFLHHESTLGVFLDLKSAYNMVSPTVLLHRLHHLGFRGHFMHFIQSYLGHRSFQVRSGVLSDNFSQEYGLVQGGVLSPMLFNVAIDSMFDEIPRPVSYAIYADDCTIWTQGRQVPQLFRYIQMALNVVGKWARKNGFRFSAEKSTAVLFRRGLKRIDMTTLPTLSINADRIPFDEQVRYLGVWLDSKLNLRAHVAYTKAKAMKRVAILKSVSGKDFGADRVVLLRLYKSLIRPILDYAAVILDGPGSRLIDSLECIQNTALRVATGALRTSPVKSLQVETNVAPLSVRRKELTLRYFLKVNDDRLHPCRQVMDVEANRHVFRGLSQQYMRRISGFPISHRLFIMCRELDFQLHITEPSPRGSVSPWMLPEVSVYMLVENKRNVTDVDIQEKFTDMVARFPGFRRFYTDGSKLNGSTGCAFTVNNAFFSHKLDPCLSVFTAELVAIREALRYIVDHRVEKSMICTDSQSAIRALATQNRDHCLLVEVYELLHTVSRNDGECVFLWIPGHRGLAGNVRADHWARMSHNKPDITRVHIGYKEFLPVVRQTCTRAFEKEWQDFRPTHLKVVKPLTGYWKSSSRRRRREEIVLARMRLGHTLLTHRHILDREPPPNCDRCLRPLDVSHILLHCRKHCGERLNVEMQCRAENVPLSIVSLLGDDHPTIIDAVFEYLRNSDLLPYL